MTPREFNRSNFKKSAADDIDIGQIGEGSFYTKGAWSGKHGNRGWGLQGQLQKYKRSGRRTETKNLSKKNLEDMGRIIEDRLQKHHRGYKVHITRQDKKAIMMEAEQLVRTKGSKFTRVDKKDLQKVVNTLQQKGREAILNRSGSPIAHNEGAPEAIIKTPESQTINLNPSLPGTKNLITRVWDTYKNVIGLPGSKIEKQIPQNQTDFTETDIDLPNPDDAEDMPIGEIGDPPPLPIKKVEKNNPLGVESIPIKKTGGPKSKTKKTIPTAVIEKSVKKEDVDDLVID